MDEGIVFRTLIVLTFFVFVGVMLPHRLRAKKAGDQTGDKLDRRKEGIVILLSIRLSGLVMLIGLVAYLINPDWMAWSNLALPTWVRWIAAGFSLIVLPPLVYWAAHTIGTNITDTVDIRKQHQLVTGGPYRYLRHPLYTTWTLLFISMSMIADSWFLLLGSVVWFAFILMRLPREEAMLIERFGDDYRDYMKRTPRFVPGLF